MNIQIICFKHCKSKIFCNNIPEQCPECTEPLSNSTLNGVPFRLPYPFVRADQYPCAVVMKSTIGTFLDYYRNDEDLHIGVTDSKGTICEYDSKGFQRGVINGWNQSILIYKISEPWMDHWDSILRNIQNEPYFTSEKYNEVDHNCYSFVLEFLKRLNYEELNQYIENKETFCKRFVVPKSRTAAIYITLYRKVKSNGYFIESS